jgi:ABC-type polysaccharide/polyol phosphate export permease
LPASCRCLHAGEHDRLGQDVRGERHAGLHAALFIWNPLFHIIDQARGFVFINYNPHYTSISYPIYVSLALS